MEVTAQTAGIPVPIFERAAILANGRILRGDDLQLSLMLPPENATGAAGTMEEIERQAIGRALEE